MIPADTTEIVEFTLKREKDLPQEQKVVFKVRPITVRGMRLINAFSKDGKFAATIEQVLALLTSHITGWRNVKNPDGSDIGFEVDNKGYCIDTNWDKFSLTEIMDIFKDMMVAMQLGEAEEKN